ncbi:MAG TPA: hypothetical protein V6C90_08175 [Coleofasciculaceae cyanobacterium]|jgi:hypothetical protein
MTKQDRLNIDLKGLRGRIENHRSDPAWKALSMAKKIRLLIEAGLEAQSEGEVKASVTSSEPKSIRQLILRNWDKLADSPIPFNRLQAMRDGENPTESDTTLLANALGLSEESIRQINNRGKQPNGT